MVTERDKIAIEWLEQFRLATPNQIAEIAYNGNMKVCYKRLGKLYRDKLIYRANNALSGGHIYSANRIRTIKQFQHDDIRNRFYLKLREIAYIDLFLVEKTFGSVRPDLVITGIYKSQPFFFLVEIETNRNHSQVNYNKYSNFWLREWKYYFHAKGTVVYVTDKKIDDEKIDFFYKHLNTSLSNFEHIFQ